jgi:hypothetical protein
MILSYADQKVRPLRRADTCLKDIVSNILCNT